MIKFHCIGFWPYFDVCNNFLIGPIKEKEEVLYINDPTKEETDIIFVNRWSSVDKTIFKGNPIIIQYSGEGDINTTYKFDYLISHEPNSSTNIYFPYFLLTGWYIDSLSNQREKISIKDIENKKFASFVASHNDVNNIRFQIVNLLNNIDQIDCGGSFLNNIGYNVPDKLEFISKYKFNLALENTKSEYYITEKIIEAFYAKTIPIYYGSSSFINTFINKKSYINISDLSHDEIFNKVKYYNDNYNLLLDTLNEPIIYNINIINDIKETYKYKLQQFIL